MVWKSFLKWWIQHDPPAMLPEGRFKRFDRQDSKQLDMHDGQYFLAIFPKTDGQFSAERTTLIGAACR